MSVSPPSPSSLEKIIGFAKENVMSLSIAIYLIVITYYTTKDPDKLFSSEYLYYTIFLVPFLFAMIYRFSSTSSPTSAPTTTADMYRYGAIGLAIIIIYYILTNVSTSETMIYLATGFIQLVFVLMAIVALAIIYKVGYNYIYKLQGWTGFIANLIFYIPCMLLDLLEYVKADLQQAPKAVPVLLIIELILIILYIYAPKISNAMMKSLSNKDGKIILKEPLTIKEEKRVSSYVDLHNVEIGEDNIVNNKYAISMWVYIVPVEPSHSPYNGDATIFEYTDYHPRLMYNGAMGKFKAYFNEGMYQEVDMPMQKWNHLVFNYTKSNADLFVNGVLKASATRENENFKVGDTIVVGQKGGLTGGICNVVYFRRPLAKYEIDSIYSLNKDLETPVI
jgi:hypothetical protein